MPSVNSPFYFFTTPTGNSRKTRELVKPSITREKQISKEGEKQHKPSRNMGIKTPDNRLAVKPLERSNKRGQNPE
ncbi:hypothetical protein SULI_13245 [Saccharolobus solfataricus]|uniref:Uncharacterized protein n=1 Tax=Saccharolobus solfataricus TaxID=2287 RepID=A0A3G8DI25_SACSO|nr:hypothetical protein SULB_03815 [Saccharolobus solfataricus]AYN75790.1 hypothetical protein SULC_03800 [Saccharolobus solfataricus]AYP18624.1 hypothetical protein SULA_03805 [Saccharolobus solfataricus]AZF69171.1 hypothetical protein SULG_13245 [Saccharolobus solfataricus]AZF71791.1 hypothetical protein SULH_13245 [Saccharolobus solfataricus]